MTNSQTMRRVVLLSAFVIALFALPTVASAADKNHDKIPDRWEKRYKLSLKVKQTAKDQDEDGLKNLAEFKAGNNPRKHDSDDDGVEDGDENAGTITSFANGVLTIDLYSGGTVTGKVTDDTRVKCHKAEDEDESGDDSSARSKGPGHGGEEGEGPEDPSGNSGPGEGFGPPRGGHGEEGEHGHCSCSTDELTVGGVVEEAELKVTAGGTTFTEIELAEEAAPVTP